MTAEKTGPEMGASRAMGDSRRRLPHFTGCLLGGAVGDALGAPIEFLSWGTIRSRYGPGGLHELVPAYGRAGNITDDTQMTLFTAEGLLRADNRLRAGGAWNPVPFIYGSYIRWLDTQGQLPGEMADRLQPSWLSRLPALRSRRAPGSTCLSSLYSGAMGRVEYAINDSKGCGGVMRVAPVALAGRESFRLGCEAAAITHSHPSGYLAAGCLAQIIDSIIVGAALRGAIDAAMTELRAWPMHEECLAALQNALALVDSGRPSPTDLESLGGGWVGEEALAIALACALVAEDFADGVLLAVNHGGDSDSTGSIVGNILGALLGAGAIPIRWLIELELRDEIEEIATDLYRHFGGAGLQDADDADDSDRYPPL